MKKNLSEIFNKNWYPFVFIFLIAIVVVTVLGIFAYSNEEERFDWVGFHTESLGMVLDIVFLGIVWAIIDSFRKSRNDIKRYKEEINDYRYWEGEEAMYRISGLIWRLNDRKEYDYDLSNCYLEKAGLGGIKCLGRASNVNFKKSILREASFAEVDLSWSDFSYADLVNVNFSRSNIRGCNFKGANLARADFRGCSDVAEAYFWGSKYIWKAKFDKDVDIRILKQEYDIISDLLDNTETNKLINFIEKSCNCIVIDYRIEDGSEHPIIFNVTKEYFKKHKLISIVNETDHYYGITANIDEIKKML